jgi:hypothetical protein
MQSELVILDRPFHFIVVLWGERFRNYFLEYCLPSLLAPGNIPALSTRTPGKFLIATRPEDWAAIKDTPIFRLMERHILPVYIELPPCPPDRVGCVHMGVGHVLCSAISFRERAYTVIMMPDSMLSNGTIARLQALVVAGAEVVLTAALRFDDELFFASLDAAGALPSRSCRDSGTSLAIGARQMVRAAVQSLHRETLNYEWNSPSFPPYAPSVPAAAWWRVPGEIGIVLHSLIWMPLVVDYGALTKHDTSAFEKWTIDGDYVSRNFHKLEAIYIVADSDEAFIGSWAPPGKLPLGFDTPSLFGAVGKGAMLRSAFYSDVFDAIKRRAFFLPVRWHAQEFNGRWDAAERRAMDTILTYLRLPPDLASVGTGIRLGRPAVINFTVPHSGWMAYLYGPLWIPWTAFLWLLAAIEYLRRRSATLLRRGRLVLKGDPTALSWAGWRARKTLAVFLHREFDEPRPNQP